MVKFYRFLDDYYKKPEYDFVITGIKGPSFYGYSNFHIWRGDKAWRMQFVLSEDFKVIVKPEFKNSIEEVNKIHLKNWMEKYLIYYIFAKEEDYKQIKKLTQKYEITVNNTNLD